jgi:hypothetical protein
MIYSARMSPAPIDKSTLAGRVSGAVFAPGDTGYVPEIAAFNTAVVHSPAVVVAAASSADVAEAVRFAAAQGLRVHVQSTGHGAHAPIAGGLLITTRRLDAVSIDAAAATATIGGGATWTPVVAAAAAHGLAPVAGSSVTVGAAGYLMGGGLGPLARSHGFSSDYLVGARVVTGPGEVVEVSGDSNPDLFWALRGGKTGLGVVTELRVRLVPLPALYAGTLFFAAEDTEAALRGWVAWTATADARVTTSAALFRMPPFELIPAPLRGRRLLCLRFAFPGPIDEGARLAAPLRAIAPVYLDALGPLPAAEVARIHNDPTTPGPSWVAARLLEVIDQDFVTRLLAHAGPTAEMPFIAAEVRHLGEATARDVPEGSAVCGRASAFAIGLVGVDPAGFAQVMPAAAERFFADVRTWVSPLTNVNFSGVPQTPEQEACTWPAATRARLREIRRRVDPHGILA